MSDPEPMTLLYEDPDSGNLILMHRDTFEQLELTRDAVSDHSRKFLEDGMELRVSMHRGEPLSINLPKEVELNVVSEGQVMGGAGPVTKLVTLSNGMDIKTPGFVNVGDTVVVATSDDSYRRRRT